MFGRNGSSQRPAGSGKAEHEQSSTPTTLLAVVGDQARMDGRRSG